jgi:hypothetical protein
MKAQDQCRIVLEGNADMSRANERRFGSVLEIGKACSTKAQQINLLHDHS